MRQPVGVRQGIRFSSLFALVVAGCDAHATSRDGVAAFRLQEFARIGSVDAPGAALSSVSSLVASDSLVFVLERSPARVAVFTRDGTWLRDIAGPGDGPGELRAPTMIGSIADTLWIGDPFGGRLELLTRNGASVGSFRWDIDPDREGVRAFPTARLRDGSVLAGPGPLGIGAALGGRVTHGSYYRVQPDGTAPEVLYQNVFARSDFISGSFATGGAFVGMHPLQESPIVTVYPDGLGLVVVERPEPQRSDTASWRLQVLGPDGAVESDEWIPYAPVETTGWLERQSAELERDMVRRSGSVDRAALDAFRTAWDTRRHYPPVTAVVAGGDGSIWIRREDTGADSTAWQVFGRDGRQRGKLRMPRATTILAASLQEVWSVERDELDIPFVVGMRVVTDAGGGPDHD